MSRPTGTNLVLGGGGLHHVALKTGRWDESLAFYTGQLGFVPRVSWQMQNGNRAVMLDTGEGNYLEIFEDPTYSPQPDGALLHLAVRTNDVDAATARMRAAGMKITMEPKAVDIANRTPPLGVVPVRISFFEGPNGEIWELFQNELT